MHNSKKQRSLKQSLTMLLSTFCLVAFLQVTILTHHLCTPGFMAAMLKHEVIRSLHKFTQCEQMWFWFVVLQKKKAGYFKIKPFDWIQTNSEASLHRKRHCIITKPSQSVPVDFAKKRKISPNKPRNSLKSRNTNGRRG